MRTAGCLYLFYILFWIIMGIGWILCLVKFVNCDFHPVDKAEIIYGIGLVTGLGGILGWFNFGK